MGNQPWQALFQLCSSGVLLQRVGRRDGLGTKLSLKNLSDGVTLPPFYTHHVIKSEVSILIHLVDFPFACTFFASTFLPFLPRWPGARARSSGFPFIFQCLPDVWSCPLRRFVALRWVFFFLFLLLFLRVDLFLIWFFWFRFLFVFLSVLF